MENKVKNNKVVSIGRRCDVCRKRKARYDAKTIHGPWAYLCDDCFERCACKIKGLYTEISDEE